MYSVKKFKDILVADKVVELLNTYFCFFDFTSSKAPSFVFVSADYVHSLMIDVIGEDNGNMLVW